MYHCYTTADLRCAADQKRYYRGSASTICCVRWPPGPDTICVPTFFKAASRLGTQHPNAPSAIEEPGRLHRAWLTIVAAMPGIDRLPCRCNRRSSRLTAAHCRDPNPSRQPTPACAAAVDSNCELHSRFPRHRPEVEPKAAGRLLDSAGHHREAAERGTVRVGRHISRSVRRDEHYPTASVARGGGASIPADTAICFVCMRSAPR